MEGKKKTQFESMPEYLQQEISITTRNAIDLEYSEEVIL